MIYGFARQSGGMARISSIESVGTTVSLVLPSATQLATDQNSQTHLLQDPTVGHGERLLIVEDLDAVRELIVEILSGAGYECMAVADAETAMHELRGEKSIDLLVTDFGLPGTNGRDLIVAARGWRPTLRVLMLTGYAGGLSTKNDFLDQNSDLLFKPFQVNELLTSIGRILNR